MLILPNNEMVISTEFNGEMDGEPFRVDGIISHGHYSEVVSIMLDINSEKNFIDFLGVFNGKYFCYNDELSCKDNLRGYKNRRGQINLKTNYLNVWHSDYLYFKNISGDKVKFLSGDSETIELSTGGLATFKSGLLIEIMVISNENKIIIYDRTVKDAEMVY